MKKDDQINIGYACITVGLPYTGLRSCTQKTATEDHLRTLINHNLNVLSQQIEYNIRHNIRLFRISSDLIPFGSSQINTLTLWDEYRDDLSLIGSRIKTSGMRVSMHPGQYTVLSSPRVDVASRAADDLIYHARILDALGTGTESKIVLHLGGVYGDKPAAIGRFAHNFENLPDLVKSRLVIENDERCYHIEDVLEVSRRLTIPVVYDNLHNSVYPADESKEDVFWIREAADTWKSEDGRQKIHYSQQDPGKKPGAHSQRIRLPEFLSFISSFDGSLPDVMLEVKDKDLSAVKCMNAVSHKQRINLLEEEWARYKYSILERDPNIYKQIRILLKNKGTYPVEEFYTLIDKAMNEDPTPGTLENAAMHVWGYFKDRADSSEKKKFERAMTRTRTGTLSHAAVKREFWKLVRRYDEQYLMKSLFFTN